MCHCVEKWNVGVVVFFSVIPPFLKHPYTEGCVFLCFPGNSCFSSYIYLLGRLGGSKACFFLFTGMEVGGAVNRGGA